MKEKLNCLPPYKIERNKDFIYSFVTDGGIKYIALFVSCKSYDDNFIDTYSFNFEPEDRNRKSVYDPRIKETIISIIEEFFRNNHNSMICVCESIDGKELCRNRLFNRWGDEYRERFYYIHKEDIQFDGEFYDLYASLLIHKENPNLDRSIESFKSYTGLLKG